ncbi:glycosyltransferase family 15 protein [Rhizophagus clarus]|uniref:Glycosyltransferase family 15 protein n=1 Tax=Rhizophagus clarus TaxID=94130 RepID=A0A8H3LSI2_9GLOM|nr:glycosyltransferase family 15 protein [Rhizophagus clarus]
MYIHINLYKFRISLQRSSIIRFLILLIILSILFILYNGFKPTIRDKFFKYEYNNPYKDPELLKNSRTIRVNACIVVLARNEELYQLKSSMRQFEDRWNKKYNYPYVFLNDVEFTDKFKEQTSSFTQSETKYAVIPKEMWSYPSWINQTKAAEHRKKAVEDQIIYGGSESYRHMCRFNSGFFFRHPALLEYDYYWRLEPSVDFMCDIDYDPFLFMKKNDLYYGFTITLYEFENTIPTLWNTTKNFMKEYPHYINDDNALKWITKDDEHYNLCHFWSNFEIANLNFWRSEPYIKYFEYLDKEGGFFYERWGDAPVHSIGLALFTNKSKIHFFNDIAYSHPPYQHCPINKDFHESGRCHCDPGKTFDLDWYSCTEKWWAL